MKFHLICQKESANVKKLLDYKKKTWEMWRKALSNYSSYRTSWWWNIYITVEEVLRVIKLPMRVSSLFPHSFWPFCRRKDGKYGQRHFCVGRIGSLTSTFGLKARRGYWFQPKPLPDPSSPSRDPYSWNQDSLLCWSLVREGMDWKGLLC